MTKRRRDTSPVAFTNDTARGWMLYGLKQQIADTTDYLLRLKDQLAALEDGRIGIDVTERLPSLLKDQRDQNNGSPEAQTLPTPEAARLLGISVSSVQRAVRLGKLTPIDSHKGTRRNPMRFTRSVLEAYKANSSRMGNDEDHVPRKRILSRKALAAMRANAMKARATKRPRTART